MKVYPLEIRSTFEACRQMARGETDAASGTPSLDGRRRVWRSRQTHALDHRLGVIQPLLLLAQMRHRRLGQSVERAPASFAAISQKPVRTTPADDPRLAQCGQP